MKEGEAGRGRAWSKRGGGCWREGIKEEGGSEGGREIKAGQAGQAGGGGRREGREGDTNDQGQAWLCTEACQAQWLLAFTLY